MTWKGSPTDFHAIHIVVKNGNVTLFGVVNNEGDSSIANMQANSAPGVFSVDNNLDVPGSPPKPQQTNPLLLFPARHGKGAGMRTVRSDDDGRGWCWCFPSLISEARRQRR
jgi:hypothetical protein